MNSKEPEEGGFSRSADADTSLLSRDGNRSRTPGQARPGWDPIPFNLLAYFCAAGLYFVTFNVWDMPELPFPLIGNLLKDTDYIHVPEAQGYVNTAFVLLLFWGLHFLRRFFEVMYVHAYTHTMSPLECIGVIVYYSLFGSWIGWSTNIFLDYFPPTSGLFALGIFIFLVGEIGNCLSHIQLKRLRFKDVVSIETFPPGAQTSQPSKDDVTLQPNTDHVTSSPSSAGHVMPSGCLFARVSCPHYLFEVITWLGFAIASFTLASFVFFLTSTLTVCVYARKRHVAYRQNFSDYPDNRKAIVPFIF